MSFFKKSVTLSRLLRLKMKHWLSYLSTECSFFAGQTCRTTSDSPGPSQNKPCVFPFKFQGKLRYGCITDADPDGRYWCSTRTDDDLNHITGQGFWGYCRSRNCPKSRVTQSTQSTKFAAQAQDECM